MIVISFAAGIIKTQYFLSRWQHCRLPLTAHYHYHSFTADKDKQAVCLQVAIIIEEKEQSARNHETDRVADGPIVGRLPLTL